MSKTEENKEETGKKEMVQFIKVIHEEQEIVLSQYQIQQTLNFMGVKLNDSQKMTKFVFKTLTKALKKARVKILLKTSSLEENSGENSEDDTATESEAPNFFSSSTDSTASFFAKKEYYDKRFLSLEEFGVKPRKVKSKGKEKRNRNHLLEKLSNLVSTLLLSKYSKKFLMEKKGILTMNRNDFMGIMKICFVAFNYNKITRVTDFIFTLDFQKSKKPFIVLLGGTSGSGKSTICSVLCSRLGIKRTVSTDSIRHMIRETKGIGDQDRKLLMSSSYLCGDDLFKEIPELEKRTIVGYQQHSRALEKYVEKVIKNAYDRNKTLLVEGVHLTMELMRKLIEKYECFGFLIYVGDEEKHRNRLSVRSKYMTLDIKHNQYLDSITRIRYIQNHLITRADELQIPKIDNSNVDQSIHFLHFSIFKTLIKGRGVYNEIKKKIKIVDPNKYTDGYRTKRMKGVITKKRRLFEGKLDPEVLSRPQREQKKKNIKKQEAGKHRKLLLNNKQNGDTNRKGATTKTESSSDNSNPKTSYVSDSVLDPKITKLSSTITKKLKKKKKKKLVFKKQNETNNEQNLK